MNFSKCHREDWTCSNCNTIVYGNTAKIICICGQTKWGSKQFPKDKYTWRIGDKMCTSCNKWNFKSNSNCKYCKTTL